MAKDISVRIDDETYIKLKAAAGAEKRSISSYVALMLEAHLATLEKDTAGDGVEVKSAGKGKKANNA